MSQCDQYYTDPAPHTIGSSSSAAAESVKPGAFLHPESEQGPVVHTASDQSPAVSEGQSHSLVPSIMVTPVKKVPIHLQSAQNRLIIKNGTVVNCDKEEQVDIYIEVSIW